MCLFNTPKTPDVEEPARYQQQKTPNRQDTVDAQTRASTNRKKATRTLLAAYQPDENTRKKTLLGAGS